MNRYTSWSWRDTAYSIYLLLNIFIKCSQNSVLKAPAEGVVNFGSLENGGKRLSELKFTADKSLTCKYIFMFYETNQTIMKSS